MNNNNTKVINESLIKAEIDTPQELALHIKNNSSIYKEWEEHIKELIAQATLTKDEAFLHWIKLENGKAYKKMYDQLVEEKKEFYNDSTSKIAATKEIMKSLDEKQLMKINDLVQNVHPSYKEIVNRFVYRAGVDRKTANSWLVARPTKREHIFWIATCLGLNENELDRLLVRYAKSYRVYERSPFDVILKFQWQNGLENLWEGATLKKQYKQLEQQYQLKYSKTNRQSTLSSSSKNTQVLASYLDEIHDVERLLQFFDEHMPEFRNRSGKIIRYLDLWLGGRNIHQVLIDQCGDGANYLEAVISDLRNNRRYPTRKKLLQLGIAFRMPQDNLNDFLECGGYEPLCPKDIVETALICILNNMAILAPMYFLEDLPEDTRQMMIERNPDFKVVNDREALHYEKYMEECYDAFVAEDEAGRDYISRFIDELMNELQEKEENA